MSKFEFFQNPPSSPDQVFLPLEDVLKNFAPQELEYECEHCTKKLRFEEIGQHITSHMTENSQKQLVHMQNQSHSQYESISKVEQVTQTSSTSSSSSIFPRLLVPTLNSGFNSSNRFKDQLRSLIQSNSNPQGQMDQKYFQRQNPMTSNPANFNSFSSPSPVFEGIAGQVAAHFTNDLKTPPRSTLLINQGQSKISSMTMKNFDMKIPIPKVEQKSMLTSPQNHHHHEDSSDDDIQIIGQFIGTGRKRPRMDVQDIKPPKKFDTRPFINPNFGEMHHHLNFNFNGQTNHHHHHRPLVLEAPVEFRQNVYPNLPGSPIISPTSEPSTFLPNPCSHKPAELEMSLKNSRGTIENIQRVQDTEKSETEKPNNNNNFANIRKTSRDRGTIKRPWEFSGPVGFPCEFCQTSFDHPAKLVEHQKGYHKTNVNQEMHWCFMCGKKYQKQLNLNKHKYLKHYKWSC